MSKFHWLYAAFLSICMLFPFAAQGKAPVLKNTSWTATSEMFVADAGTMTITHTMVFGHGNKIEIKHVSDLPPYPAMYMNPDGSVDTIAGMHSEWSEEGTFRFRRGVLTVTLKEGPDQEYLYQASDGTFSRKDPIEGDLVFTRNKE